MNTKITSIGDWAKNDPKSYHRAKKLKITKDIAKAFGWKVSDPEQKKEQLLTIAKAGEPKPQKGKHPLCTVLKEYTNPNSRSYDDLFYKEIIKVRPDWFLSPSVAADKKKEQILIIAKAGEARPVGIKHTLGRPLQRYTDSNCNCYDEFFDKEIRKLRPDWFENTSDIKKERLLEMARAGESRPHVTKHPLGASFNSYITPSADCYDPHFDMEIRSIAPKWFENSLLLKLEALLLLENRPSSSSKDPEEKRLSRAIGALRKHKPEIYEKLVKAKPDWSWRAK